MKKRLDPYRIIALIGLAKNTGKTTTLNAIRPLYKDQLIALTSIGLDGETLDAITRLPKPKVIAQPNEWIATAEACLKDKAYRLIEKTNIQTALGNIYIVQFLKPTEVVLAGPSTNQEMQKLVNFFPNKVTKIFIDGAFDKKTFSSIDAVEALILSTGATIGETTDLVVTKTIDAIELLTLEVLNKPFNASIYLESDNEVITLKTKDFQAFKDALKKIKPACVYIKGAVTNRYIEALLRINSPLTLVMDDMSKWLVEDKYFKTLKKLDYKLKVLHQKPLLFITISPFKPHLKNMDVKALKHALKKHTSYPVIDVLESEDANE